MNELLEKLYRELRHLGPHDTFNKGFYLTLTERVMKELDDTQSVKSITSVTFKDKLAEKAYDYETNIKLEEQVFFIKKQMEDFYTKREYKISLVKPKPGEILALGSSSTNCTSLFIPKRVEPTYYQQLFINAFKDLGFTDADIILNTEEDSYCVLYNIILRW